MNIGRVFWWFVLVLKLFIVHMEKISNFPSLNIFKSFNEFKITTDIVILTLGAYIKTKPFLQKKELFSKSCTTWAIAVVLFTKPHFVKLMVTDENYTLFNKSGLTVDHFNQYRWQINKCFRAWNAVNGLIKILDLNPRFSKATNKQA